MCSRSTYLVLCRGQARDDKNYRALEFNLTVSPQISHSLNCHFQLSLPTLNSAHHEAFRPLHYFNILGYPGKRLPTYLTFKFGVSNIFQASQVLGAPTTETITGSNGVQYKVVELEWKAQAFVNGPFLNVTGTVEKVLAELHSINSNYEADWAPHLAASQNLTKRDQFPATGYNCFGRWPGAYRTHVLGGIEYLRGVSGTPGEGPGPGTCGRVSCSYNTGIHWCNDVSLGRPKI